MNDENDEDGGYSLEETQALGELYEKISDLCEDYQNLILKPEDIMGVLCSLSVRNCLCSCETDPLMGMYLHQQLCNEALLSWIKNDKDEFEKFIMTTKDDV